MGTHRSTSIPLRAIQILVAAAVLITCRVARAAVDAISNAQASADDLVTVVITYGPSIGGMYVAYLVARSLVERARAGAAATGTVGRVIAWLRIGKNLAYAVSALAVAGAALQAELAGSTWRVVVATAVAAAFKLIVPVPAQPDIPTSTASA